MITSQKVLCVIKIFINRDIVYVISSFIGGVHLDITNEGQISTLQLMFEIFDYL